MKRSAISLIFDQKDSKVLTVYNKRVNGWTLPGGKVEEGESVNVAQRRELKEETSLVTLFAIRIYEDFSASDSGRLVTIYLVAAKGEPKECEEGCPVQWMSVEDLIEQSPFSKFYKKMFNFLLFVDDV